MYTRWELPSDGSCACQYMNEDVKVQLWRMGRRDRNGVLLDDGDWIVEVIRSALCPWQVDKMLATLPHTLTIEEAQTYALILANRLLKWGPEMWVAT